MLLASVNLLECIDAGLVDLVYCPLDYFVSR